jgi:hypothetical protein
MTKDEPLLLFVVMLAFGSPAVNAQVGGEWITTAYRCYTLHIFICERGNFFDEKG